MRELHHTEASIDAFLASINRGSVQVTVSDFRRGVRLVTSKEAADILGITHLSFWSKIQRKRLTGLRFLSEWRFADEAMYRLVRTANDYNLKILAVINYTPAWARDPECAALVQDENAAQTCMPRDNREFATFTRMLAIRYKDTNVRAWEIWNEPNLTGHWKSPRDGTIAVSPTIYADMANEAASQIHHNYPDCVVVTGGLAPLFEPTAATGMRQSDYLAALLPQLKSELFTGIAIHPYSWPALPDKVAEYNAFYSVDNGEQDLNLRAIMARAGWADKEIWGTEYGASTKGQRLIGIPWLRTRPDHVTEDMQAKIVTQGMVSWYDKENVGPLFIHSDSDEWLEPQKNEGGFGLRRSDGTKKPAYDALERAAQGVQRKSW